MAAPNPSREPGFFDAGALAAEYVDDLIVGTTRDMHQVIAARAFNTTNAVTGGGARLPQVMHDGISAAVYTGISTSLKVASVGLRVAGDNEVGRRLTEAPAGRAVVSVVNGLIGDRLALENSRMAIRMAVRSHGRDVPLDPDSIATAHPDATDSIVVFVHGLIENEEHWQYRAKKGEPSYGQRLAAETDWTPVYVRVNTGLSIAENGVGLAALLEDLIAAWPFRPRRIAIVGHSMGALIARSACSVQTEATHPWTRLVTNIVSLGAPHLGSPVAKGASAIARFFGKVPETAGFGRILDTRSIGIVDLERSLARHVENLPHARYHLVGATLTRAAGSPLGAALGDLLVRLPSAFGRPRRGAMLFPDADELHVGLSHHFDLLNHPDVYRALKQWLQ